MKRIWFIALIIVILAAIVSVVWLTVPRSAPPASTPSVAQQMFAMHFDLGPHEVIRFIPLPGPPTRFGTLSSSVGGFTPASARTSGSIFFRSGRMRTPSGLSTGNLAEAVSGCLSFEKPEPNILPELREVPIPGDWVVRKDAPRDQRMVALQTILRDQLHRPITIRLKDLDVFVVPYEGVTTAPGTRS